MFSLQRFLCRDEKFFDLIEDLANASTECVRTVASTLQTQTDPTQNSQSAQNKLITTIKKQRNDCKEAADTLDRDLCVSFLTPLDREDIGALSTALLKISKTAEKLVFQYTIFQRFIRPEDFRRQSELISKSADLLYQMVTQLRAKADLKEVKGLSDQLKFHENESDRILLGIIETLYVADEKNIPPLTVIATKNLQELMEKLTARMREAGNIVFRTILKYS